ncbi:MAG: acyl-CoA dehydrogenase family protein [Thermoanaerobaculia bacterium]
MTTEAEQAFFDSAREAFRRDPGIGAFDALGVWDLLDALADREARAATFAAFRAHGRELGRSAALGCLLAHPYVAADGVAPGSVAVATPRRSVRRGDVLLLVGEPSVEQVLIDRPGTGARIVPIEDVELQPVRVAGRLCLHELTVAPDAHETAIPEERAKEARRRSTFLGRIAAAFEILGAAEGALDLALEHACTREQFGAPIGSFQAVRHLLAWARTDLAAALDVNRLAAALDLAAPPRFDEIAKALAGRNGRRVSERALQVLGGIGFTAEQDHHHFHSRVLALDSVLGTSAELARVLGTWLRENRTDPRIPRALLHRGGGS